MTSPRALRLLLMACASFRHSPVLPDFFTLQALTAMGRWLSNTYTASIAGSMPNYTHAMLKTLIIDG